MPRPYPPEFRFRAVALVRAGKPITTAAIELGISAAALHKWVRRDQVDRGERPGLTTTESVQLPKANKRIRQLEAEVEILCTAATLFGENRPAQKDSPGDRLPPRRRAPGQGLLPASWCQQPRLLHVQDPADVTDTDAPSVAHWVDPRSPDVFATDLRVPTCACGAYARYGHRGQ